MFRPDKDLVLIELDEIAAPVLGRELGANVLALGVVDEARTRGAVRRVVHYVREMGLSCEWEVALLVGT